MLTAKQEGRLEKCAKLRVIDVTPTFAEALRFLFCHRGAQVLTVMATPVREAPSKDFRCSTGILP